MILLTSTLTVYGQSIVVNTKEGRKTLYADKTRACNKDLVFMISAESPKFDDSTGKFDARLNSLINFDKTVKGDVIVWFVINCNGEAYGFQIIRGINEELNKKIIDALTKLQHWNPGRQDGKPIDSVYNLKLEIKKGKITVS